MPHTTGNPTPVTPGFGPSFGVGGLVLGESSALGMGPVFFVDTPTNVMNNVNRMSAVVLENVSCLNNFFMGMMSPSISNMTIASCHFDDTWADDPGRIATLNGPPAYVALTVSGLHLVHGVSPTTVNGNIDPNCVNVVASNSTFNRSTIRGDYTTSLVAGSPSFIAAGATDTRSQNVVWNDCQFNNSSNTFVALASNSQTIGFVCGGVEDYTFNNCHFDGAFNVGPVAGFHVSGTTANQPIKSNRNVRLITCSANNLHFAGDQAKPAPTLTSDFMAGFNLYYVKDCILDGCVCQDLINTTPVSGSSFNAGIYVSSNSNVSTAEVENVTIRNCLVSRVQSFNGGQARGYNIIGLSFSNSTLTNNLLSVVVENCSSTGNEAFTPPSVPVLNVPAWSAATNYGPGISVSYLGINYVSLIASDPSNGGAVIPLGHPTVWAVIAPASLANTYDPSVDYVANGIVVYNNVNYKALAANGPGTTVVTPGSNSAVWSLNTGITWGAGVGFHTEHDENAAIDAPTLYINCIAARNKGVATTTVFGVTRYSAGFQLFGGNSYIFDSCKAVDNLYGFILNGSTTLTPGTPIQSTNCAIRNCQSDNNSTTFTPAGLVLSVSVASGGTGYNVNDTLTLNTGSGTAQVLVTAVNASHVITAVALIMAGSGYNTGIVTTTTSGAGMFATINILSVLTGSIESATVPSLGTGSGYSVGDILTVLTGSGTAQVMVTSVTGSAVTGITIVNPGYGYITGTFGTTYGGPGTGAMVTITAVAVGEGFTDTGVGGNVALPTQSKCIWESNRAYNNGAGGLHVGPNGNYNIWMDAGPIHTLRPPLLSGQASTGVYTPTDPATYFASLHNNSVIA